MDGWMDGWMDIIHNNSTSMRQSLLYFSQSDGWDPFMTMQLFWMNVIEILDEGHWDHTIHGRLREHALPKYTAH